MPTEQELEGFLVQGRCRLRTTAGLRGACLGLGLGLAGAAIGVAAARLQPESLSTILPWSLWLPPVLGLLGGIVGFTLSQPGPLDIAMRLDRGAKLADHLTTWADLRHQPAGDEWRQAFIQAQKAATCRIAGAVDPSRHLPLRLPAWSRALLLGGLALGCALLMPERAESRRQHLAKDQSVSQAEAGGGERQSRAEPLNPLNNETPFRVQIIPPTDLYQATLAAQEGMPEALKQKWLNEIEKRRGSLGVNELTDDVRELRELLARQLGRKPQSEKDNSGSQQTESTENKRVNERPEERFTAALPPPGKAEDLVGITQARYPDAAVALERYYRAPATGKEGKAMP